MRLSLLVSAVALGFLAPKASATDEDPVAVRVGSAELRASDVTRRLAALPSFQRRALGDNPADVRRHFVDRALVPELLLADEAERQALDKKPSVERRLDDALRRALVDSIERGARAAVTKDAARAYYDAHPDEFAKPQRIRIWRILVDDPTVARSILADAKSQGGPARWSHAARDHSLDDATKMRSGLLGFVYPDGRTEVPRVEVDPALYAAAATVKDGELVPDPVKEGTHLAVVWRRGTLPKEARTFAESNDAIGDLLARQSAERILSKLLGELRHRYVKDETPALIDTLPKGEALPLQGPGHPAHPVHPITAAAPSGSARVAPAPGPRGLR